ncbi:hypothetical protein F511_23586 [Dorcoceras hygrometricum]|uniref:Uncharacterized protein n=1 Tax=Dorcoceras hygrometricum TaxID=472368 RepID=A0A2Z7BWE3_9LAMI|nr:hypothetical protein F511_23586 [Dorcoceras hygrometricum]
MRWFLNAAVLISCYVVVFEYSASERSVRRALVVRSVPVGGKIKQISRAYLRSKAWLHIFHQIPYLEIYFPISFSVYQTLDYCSPLILSGDSHRFQPSFWTCKVALDSSWKALSPYTSFGGYCSLERDCKTTALGRELCVQLSVGLPQPSFWTCKVALDSSWKALSPYTSFGGYCSLERDCKTTALGRNPGFTAGRGFNPAGGAPGGAYFCVICYLCRICSVFLDPVECFRRCHLDVMVEVGGSSRSQVVRMRIGIVLVLRLVRVVRKNRLRRDGGAREEARPRGLGEEGAAAHKV